MAEAIKDNNKVPTIMGVLNTDGTTPTRLTADPATHILQVMNDITGSDLGTDNASRDNSGIPTSLAVSSVDEATPVLLYVDSNGFLLVDAST